MAGCEIIVTAMAPSLCLVLAWAACAVAQDVVLVGGPAELRLLAGLAFGHQDGMIRKDPRLRPPTLDLYSRCLSFSFGPSDLAIISQV